MGANQSSSSEKLGGSFEPLDGVGSPDTPDSLASRLQSPMVTMPSSRVKSRFSFQNLSRSLSTSMYGSSGALEPAGGGRQPPLLSRMTSRSTISLATDSHQVLMGAAGNSRSESYRQGHRHQARPGGGGGIVVVNPGRPKAHSHSDLSSLSNHNGAARPAEELHRQLRRVPLFEPLIPTANANLGSLLDALPNGSTSDKRVPRFEHYFDSYELSEIATCYANLLRQTVTTVGRQQTEIVGLQNKVDYDVRRLTTVLAARVNGIPAASGFARDDGNGPGGSVGTDIVARVTGSGLAGVRQVDSFVLQTSQLSSLLAQCTLMAQEVLQAVDELNDRLPEDQRLRWPSDANSTGCM